VDVRSVNANREWFSVVQTSKHTQTAMMTLAPGEASGEKGNDHPSSEQVLLVLEGEVVADVVDLVRDAVTLVRPLGTCAQGSSSRRRKERV